MKFSKFIALVFISIGALSTIDRSLADNKNPDNYKVLSNKNDKFSIINVQNFLDSGDEFIKIGNYDNCLLYTSPSPRDATTSRMPSSA